MTLIIIALIITTVLVIVATVMDLGMVRQNRQADKSASDLAAAAGIRALDNGGAVQPWAGICTARDFLLANNDEMSGMTASYADGNGTALSDPCAAPPAAICANSPVPNATWGVFTGVADGGRIRVTIRNGYPMPDTNFPEDGDEYAGDDTDACENLAVIIEEGEPAHFGGVAGASGYETVIRSVARLQWEYPGDVAPALLLLERNKCNVLLIGGSSGAVVTAMGLASSPGVIHSDSLGNDSGTCDPDDPQTGNIFQVNSNPTSPLIVVEASGDDTMPGELSAVALSGAAGADDSVVSSPTPNEVCAELKLNDCDTPTSGPLLGRDLVTRSGVDSRYRSHVRALRQDAATKFGWDAGTAQDAGFDAISCTDPIPATDRIWIDCAGGAFDGGGKTFGPSVEEVVINGYVSIGGRDKTLQFTHVDRLYVKGRTDGAAIAVEGSEGNKLAVNAGADPAAACAETAADVGATTKMVIGSGHLEVAGGNSADNPKVLRLCHTMLLMADNSGSSCPIPSVDGFAPYSNSCVGRIRIAGQATVDWTAPNVRTSSAVASDHQHFEDLAFWTETEGAGVEWGITGNGNVKLAGVFFTPNADPVRVGGNGTYSILDAQFVTRRLEVAGNASLTMQPDPRNAITIPWIGGFSLVR